MQTLENLPEVPMLVSASPVTRRQTELFDSQQMLFPQCRPFSTYPSKEAGFIFIFFSYRKSDNFIYHSTLIFPLWFSFLNIFFEVLQITKIIHVCFANQTTQHKGVSLFRGNQYSVQCFFLVVFLLTQNKEIYIYIYILYKCLHLFLPKQSSTAHTSLQLPFLNVAIDRNR